MAGTTTGEENVLLEELFITHACKVTGPVAVPEKRGILARAGNVEEITGRRSTIVNS